jgi:hypothetical protein
MLQITYIVRSRKRIPAINMGNGLLRPVPTYGYDIAEAAWKADMECALGIPPAAPPAPLTIVKGPQLNGATSVSGGAGRMKSKKTHAYRWDLTPREGHLSARAWRKFFTGKVSKDYDCWKRHRRTQSRQKAQSDFFCTA